MNTIITAGTRKVLINNQNSRNEYQCRLYVNNGTTATLIANKFLTLKGAEKWARKVLSQ